MQIDCSAELPPGYFETHAADGVSWRSSHQARCMLDERALSNLVRRFERDARKEMRDQKRRQVCEAVSLYYEVREIWLEVSQQPWETIPRVFLEEEGK